MQTKKIWKMYQAEEAIAKFEGNCSFCHRVIKPGDKYETNKHTHYCMSCAERSKA